MGHNSVLLLNVPPNRSGLIAAPDVQRLREFRNWQQRTFAVDLARGKPASASSSVASGAMVNGVITFTPGGA